MWFDTIRRKKVIPFEGVEGKVESEIMVDNWEDGAFGMGWLLFWLDVSAGLETTAAAGAEDTAKKQWVVLII